MSIPAEWLTPDGMVAVVSGALAVGAALGALFAVLSWLLPGVRSGD